MDNVIRIISEPVNVISVKFLEERFVILNNVCDIKTSSCSVSFEISILNFL